MKRPSFLHVGGTLYWTIRLYNTTTQALVDADSTPTVAIRKNGSSTADSVTVNKRSATTGIYDCSYNPASEVEGDEFTVEETAVISSTTYSASWEFSVIAVERGTDDALKPTTNGRTLDVTASGNAGIDLGNVENATATLNLSGTSVGTASALGAQAKLDVNTEVDTALSDAGVTSTRQGKLDNIPASTVASQADVLAINQSASRRIVLFTSFNYEIPSSGSDTYEIELRTNDPDGAAETPSSVTLTASGNSGSYDARISASSTPATGVTRWTFTVQSTDVSEQVRLRVSAVLADATFTASAYPNLTNVDAQDFTSSDRTKLEAVYAKLPSANYLTGTASSNGSGYSTLTTGDIATQSQTGAAAALTAYDAATGTDVSAVETKVDTANTSLTSIASSIAGIVTKFGGITLLKNWLAIIMGKSADAPTLAEVNATTAGATYANTTDSLESIRDRGDAAWVTGGGGGSGGDGEYAVTITATDTAATAVGNLGYTIKTTLGAKVYASNLSNSGTATVNLDDGSYRIYWGVNTSHEAHAYTSFTVAGAAVSVTVNDFVPITSAAAADTSKCNVVFLVTNESAVKKNAKVVVQLKQNARSGDYVATPEPITRFTDANGRAEIEMFKYTGTDGTAIYDVKIYGPNGNLWHHNDNFQIVTDEEVAYYSDLV